MSVKPFKLAIISKLLKKTVHADLFVLKLKNKDTLNVYRSNFLKRYSDPLW